MAGGGGALVLMLSMWHLESVDRALIVELLSGIAWQSLL